MKLYDDRAGAIRRDRQRVASAFDASAGFCALCWRRTEEQTTNDMIFAKKRGKFVEVARPQLSPETLEKAKGRLEEIRAAASGGDPYLFGGLLHEYARGYDHRTIGDRGIGSAEATEMLMDVIELNLIEDEWLATETEAPLMVGRKRFNGIVPPDETAIAESAKAPLKPSATLCAEHNPRRSVEARRRYQNDLRRKEGFEEVIRHLTATSRDHGHGIHTVEDRMRVRKQAYKVVCMSTLDMIKALQAEGVANQAEIGRRLGLSRKAISLALARERQRHKHSPCSDHTI